MENLIVADHFFPSVPDKGGIPRVKPPFWTLFVDVQGRIWVGRHVPAEFHPSESENRSIPREWIEPSVWDVLDPRGTSLGTIRLPREGRIMAAENQMIWVLESGEFEEEYLVGYRITEL